MQPGGLDMEALLKSAQAMQQQVAEAQASLADARASGSAGGGLVRAETDGNGQLVRLDIDPSVVDPTDIETLADLVVAAVRDGARAAEKLAQESMGSVAGGLMGGTGGTGLPGGAGGGLPGLDALLGGSDAPEPHDGAPAAGSTSDTER